MRRLLLIVAMAMVAAGCEEEIETPGSENFQPSIVVNGVFTDEVKIQSIKLTYSGPVNDDAPPSPVSNAVVEISDGLQTIPLLETISGSGIYESTVAVGGRVGTTYTLLLKHNGQTYTASDSMTPAGSIDSLTYRSIDNGFYEWDVPKNHTLEPGTTYEWKTIIHHPDGQINSVTSYNFTGLETSAFFSLNQMSQTFRFRSGTRIVQHKLSLSPGFYQYLKAVYSETVWQGDLYDVTPANAPTNLSGGAQGFFRVSSVVSTEQNVK